LDRITKLPTKKNFLLFGQITGENSQLDRKNTWDAVECFIDTFKKHADVGLIIKTNSGTNCKMDLRVTERKLTNFLSKIRPKNCKAKIYMLHGYLNNKEIAGLYKSKKIIGLISGTRGEGFGLPLLEASVSGLPVIATDWSGHKDFLDRGEWLAVKNKLVPVAPAKIDGNIFVSGAQWAQIDKGDFAKNLIRLYKNPSFYRKKAKLLSIKLKSEFGFESIAIKYDELMRNL
jgi:glycosyltransferase involved in cell wall biosynthesis